MYTKIFKYFLAWRVGLFFVAFLSIFYLPTFGARFPYADKVLEVTNLPYWIWGFGNFDGVHYIKIAQDGYQAAYAQAFFPVFPILMKIFAFGRPDAVFYSGLILSNIFFLGALFIFYRLLRLDFKKDVAFFMIISLLVFPTSFYFGAIYTESLFLLLTVSALYLQRRRKFFWSAAVIALASATKIFGILLLIPYVVEVWQRKDKSQFVWLTIAPLGLITYMYYLQVQFGDPFYFMTSQPAFGASRSSDIILLPQVFYRYIKIFLTTDVLTLPFFNAALEFTFTLVPLGLLLLLYKKMRLSYWLFSLVALLLAPLTGTLSSMPRYAILPMVFILPYTISRFRKMLKPVTIGMVSLEIILVMLFIRGYWVA